MTLSVVKHKGETQSPMIRQHKQNAKFVEHMVADVDPSILVPVCKKVGYPLIDQMIGWLLDPQLWYNLVLCQIYLYLYSTWNWLL